MFATRLIGKPDGTPARKRPDLDQRSRPRPVEQQHVKREIERIKHHALLSVGHCSLMLVDDGGPHQRVISAVRSRSTRLLPGHLMFTLWDGQTHVAAADAVFRGLGVPANIL